MPRPTRWTMLLALLAGCAHQATPEEAGPYPAHYRELIKAYLIENVNDPYTMKDVMLSAPRPSASGVLGTPSWWVCLRSTRKDLHGDYYTRDLVFSLDSREGGDDVDIVVERAGALLPSPTCTGFFDLKPWPEMTDLASQSKN
jgi:hypothetical protein